MNYDTLNLKYLQQRIQDMDWDRKLSHEEADAASKVASLIIEKDADTFEKAKIALKEVIDYHMTCPIGSRWPTTPHWGPCFYEVSDAHLAKIWRDLEMVAATDNIDQCQRAILPLIRREDRMNFETIMERVKKMEGSSLVAEGVVRVRMETLEKKGWIVSVFGLYSLTEKAISNFKEQQS